MTTPLLKLGELASGQANAYATVNAALRQLEALTVRVLSATTAAQPTTPADGDAYIVPAGATGTDWATYTAGQIAYYSSGAWYAYTPATGMRMGIADTNTAVQWNGTAWATPAAGAPSYPTVAVSANTTLDATYKGNVLLVDASAGAVTVTLPDSATVGSGFVVGALKIDSSANAVTIAGAGTDTIQGAATLALARQWSGTLLDTDGAGSWVQIGGGGGTQLPIDDDQILLQNVTDATKQARFDASSIPTGTAVVLTLPGATGTLARLADIPASVGSSDLDEDSTTTTGLTWGWKAGAVRSSTALIQVAAGTLTLTASTTNYVEVDSAGSVSVNQTGWTPGRIPLRILVTGASSITTSTDERAWLIVTGDMQSDGSVPMTGDLDLGGHQLKNYAERTATVNATTATTTLDLSLARHFAINMQANTTLAFSNVPASGVTSVTLDFVQDATGSRLLTLPTGTRTPGGAGITLSTAANTIDRVVMDNGNGAWNAFLAGAGMA